MDTSIENSDTQDADKPTGFCPDPSDCIRSKNIQELAPTSIHKLRARTTMEGYNKLWFKSPEFQGLIDQLNLSPQENLEAHYEVLCELFHVLTAKSVTLYGKDDFVISQNLLHLALKVQKQAMATFMILNTPLSDKATPLPLEEK